MLNSAWGIILIHFYNSGVFALPEHQGCVELPIAVGCIAPLGGCYLEMCAIDLRVNVN